MKFPCVRLVLFFQFVLTAIPFCLPPAGAAGLPAGANPWAYASLACRREVQLPPDAARSRTNAPIFLDLKKLGTVELATIKVDEITNTPAVPCTVAAYAQPSGRDPRAYWVASGTTAAGQTRRFLIYYNQATSAPAYPFSWSRGGASSSFSNTTANSGAKYYYTLKGDRLDFMRSAHTLNDVGDGQHAVMYEQNSGFFRCQNRSTGFNCLSGIRATYTIEGDRISQPIKFSDSGMERYFDAIKWDRNGPTAAMNIHYSIKDPFAHQAELTHRIYVGQPLLEFSMTATPNSGAPLEYSRDIFHARQFYWNDATFTPVRMVTDLGRDGALSTEDDVKNWLILADSSGNAIGLFTFKPGAKRKLSSTRSLQDFYNLASEQGSVYVYYGVGKTDELRVLFDTMKRGYPLGLEQQPKFNIMSPGEDARFIPGESINAVVAGPSVGSDLSLRLEYPDKTYKIYKPSAAGASNTFNLGTLATTSKFGVWTLTATSGGVIRTRKIQAVNPAHPRMLFTQSELSTIRARWKTDSRYQTHVQDRLTGWAKSILADPPPPATLTKGGPRWYGRDLLFLAGALLMDPTQQQIRTRMWSDFKTMMAWKQWDPVGNGCYYFGGDDVERGEALQALITVYDWFYSDLTPAQRRQYADQFARYADALLRDGLAGFYPVKWDTYNSIDNSRTVSQDAALAGIERALTYVIPSVRRAPWRTRLEANFAALKRTLCTDGSYNAGQSYHALLLWDLFFWSETRRLNGDTSLYSSAWFREMPSYVLYGMMPGRVGNFGGLVPFGNCDSGPYYSLQTDLAIPSLRGGNRVAQWISEKIGYSRVEPYQCIWQDYNRAETDPATLPNWHFFPRRGIFVYRSSWANNAVYFATKCGEFWGGHEHPDLGTFVIHRNGYPYITGPQYLALTSVEDENILVANGKTPRGRNGEDGYANPTDPIYWGKTPRALGSPDYFNVLQDPRPAYEDGANLKSYNREFVGFKDVIVLRDKIAANASSTFKLNFHAFKTDPQVEVGTAYDADQYPTSQVFEQYTSTRTKLFPNKSKSPSEFMTIQDLSPSSWSTRIEAWKLALENVPGPIAPGEDRDDNDDKNFYQRGWQLSRNLSGVSSATGLQAFHFRGDAYNNRAWSSAVADAGLVLYYGAQSSGDDRIKVVWPKGGKMTNVSGAEGLTVTGAMAMRNYENKDFGGRDLTLLRDDSKKGEKKVLLSSTVPVTLVSKTAASVGAAWIACDSAAKVTLYCPKGFTTARFNGKTIIWTSSGSQKTFTLPATPLGAKLELLTAADQGAAAAPAWAGYR